MHDVKAKRMDLCIFCKKPVNKADGDRVEQFSKFHIPPCPERE